MSEAKIVTLNEPLDIGPLRIPAGTTLAVASNWFLDLEEGHVVVGNADQPSAPALLSAAQVAAGVRNAVGLDSGGAMLDAAGNPISATGASTLAQMTDRQSFDIPSNNTPTKAALAAKLGTGTISFVPSTNSAGFVSGTAPASLVPYVASAAGTLPTAVDGITFVPKNSVMLFDTAAAVWRLYSSTGVPIFATKAIAAAAMAAADYPGQSYCIGTAAPYADYWSNGSDIVLRGSSSVVAPTLPQPSSIVAQWSADAIIAQADNTALASWTDSKAGIVASQATSANQPMYRTSRLGGKPSVQFPGSAWLSISTPGAMKTAIDSQIYTVVIVASQVQSQSFGCLFGSSAGGNSLMYLADGALAGRFAGNQTDDMVPWTSSGMLVMGATSITPYAAGSGNGLERLYMQGGCVHSITAAGPVSSGASGSFGIGANSIAGTFPVKADIHEILIWNKQLTPLEMLNVQTWVCSKYSQTLPWSGAARFVVFDGDSLTGSTGASSVSDSYPYKVAQGLDLAYGQWTMTAVGGMRFDNMLSKIGEWSGIPAYIGVPVRVAADEYYNCRNDSGGAPTILGYASAYAAAVRALPSTKLILGTSTSHSGDPDAVRAAYDSGITSAPSNYGDQIVSLHTNASIGVSGAYAANSSTYWSDGVHLNSAGYAIKATLMQAGIIAAA